MATLDSLSNKLDHMAAQLARLEAAVVHEETHVRRIERVVRVSEAAIEKIEASAGRTEEAAGLIQAAAERLEKNVMALVDDLQTANAKLDAFTTDMATVIDSAVARIITEIGKQGTISADAQAALDHLGLVADNLTAFKADSAQKIIDAGVPPPVPPVGPVPPAPEPVPV